MSIMWVIKCVNKKETLNYIKNHKVVWGEISESANESAKVSFMRMLYYIPDGNCLNAV